MVKKSSLFRIWTQFPIVFMESLILLDRVQGGGWRDMIELFMSTSSSPTILLIKTRLGETCRDGDNAELI